MKKYIVNDNPAPDGFRRVHAPDCPYPPDDDNQRPLGEFKNIEEAVREAKNPLP